MLLLGFDIGSSSVKAALVDAGTSRVLGVARHPETEMPISAPHPDHAEQDPEDWWQAVCEATRKLLAQTGAHAGDIGGIGIGYQMHGLVCVDKAGQVLRPAIIWCDSRAISQGQQAFEAIGEAFCLSHYLNSPGNFTASKLGWVKQHEPHVFEKIHKIMLPGDYIACRMTGEMATTITGLSEGIFWDFQKGNVAADLMRHFGFPDDILPEKVPVFSIQGTLSGKACEEIGLPAGIPVCYRAGDQPNNALALNVLRPGEVAATGGTSGVVYAVSSEPLFDSRVRVNSFAHVNYTPENPLTGVLLCINGTGSAYRWARQSFGHQSFSYEELEKMAAKVQIGSDGLQAYPFGNGAERMLGNKNPGATFTGIQFNRHEPRHVYRAILEGIACSFMYGMEAMREMEISPKIMRAGADNLFQSDIFTQTLATLSGIRIEIRSTTGAAGAAFAAGVAAGAYNSIEEAMQESPVLRTAEPDEKKRSLYRDLYQRWKKNLY
jgi:xylulokinase